MPLPVCCIRFERVYLGDLPRFPPGSVVDVLGFVVGAKEVETVLSRVGCLFSVAVV